ncbi:hypothetical protein CWI38_2600p0010 [Hamiltosporidium tvaerminnensis]|uniref:Uncharacterized protein n=1 Tax=Hamiltosporidium tvaerminnensis TaxID=1176355 RepID=A0A4Q9LEC4_9MICR|nr:hypothetical protein CWI38_2600p0010 [Hamiltosporidium tvaerminnensis]
MPKSSGQSFTCTIMKNPPAVTLDVLKILEKNELEKEVKLEENKNRRKIATSVRGYDEAHIPESITDAAHTIQAAPLCYDEATRK